MNGGIRYLTVLCLGAAAAFACSSDDSSSSNTGGDNSSGGSGGSGDGGTGGTGGDGGSAGEPGTGGTGGIAATGGSGGTMSGSGGNGGAGASSGGSGSGGDASGGTGGGASCGECEDVCLPSGECVECAASEDCGGDTPVCDTEANVCVECLPSDDSCEAGYCSENNECVLGCKDDAMCASGVCEDTNDCDRCIADEECAGDRVCGNGTCADACSDEGAGCGTDGTCCTGHCVDVSGDINHCGACGVACGSGQFCATADTVECVDAVIANLCGHTSVTVLRDGLTIDDAAGAAMLAAITDAANCTTEPTGTSVAQDSAPLINTTSGQPLAGPGNLLIAAGGDYRHLVTAYLQQARIAPVYNRVGVDVEFRLTADDTVVGSIPYGSLSADRDLLVIQLVRDPLTGTTILNAYGFGPPGTTAAGWFVTNVMLPDIASYTDSYYVYEWNDTIDDGAPTDETEFDLRGSG